MLELAKERLEFCDLAFLPKNLCESGGVVDPEGFPILVPASAVGIALLLGVVQQTVELDGEGVHGYDERLVS